MKKTPLVSCIVTTKNEQKNIENCLEGIKKQTYKNIEIIVVDNNSKDETKNIARKYTSNVFNKGPERSAQRNYGVGKSCGEYVFLLDADMILTPLVVEKCVEKIGKNDDLYALVVPEKSFGEGFWAQCKALERSFYLGVDWIEAARFYKKEIFKKLKGYDENQTGTEDFDLPQRLKATYGDRHIGRINAFILHNEGKLSLLGTMKKKYYYAKTLHKYNQIKSNKKSFKKQLSIFNRYILYFSKADRLFANPILGLGMLFMKTSEFLAGGVGYITKKV